MDDTVVDVWAGFVKGVRPGLPRRLRGRDNTLGTRELERSLDACRLEIHRMVERGGEIVGTRRSSLLAGAALRGRCWLDEAIGLCWSDGAALAVDWLLLPGREEVGHEARHDWSETTVPLRQRR